MFTAIQSPNNSFITQRRARKSGKAKESEEYMQWSDNCFRLTRISWGPVQVRAKTLLTDHFHSKTSLNGLVRPKMTNGYQQCLLSEQLPIERIGVVHAGGCLSFAVNSFEQNNTERLTGRSAKVVSSSFCHGSCGAQGPKSVGQKYNRLFWPSSSSRRSAFAIVLSTLARVKLAVLVGVQCKEFLPKKEHVPQILPLGLIDNRRPASFFLH
ncbi:hypothetical protein T4B_12671 [Trichinella pseudospiralis]|uniref:Uncharacterized protein n=1 Tax=Trichinella pseudospiralis TaxID=6337 RepID=A0A0V1IKV7_TRIPS|nr:hypothetical protein T4B_12671 [Trichinella pseudospiralis]